PVQGAGAVRVGHRGVERERDRLPRAAPRDRGGALRRAGQLPQVHRLPVSGQRGLGQGGPVGVAGGLVEVAGLPGLDERGGDLLRVLLGRGSRRHETGGGLAAAGRHHHYDDRRRDVHYDRDHRGDDDVPLLVPTTAATV